MEILKKGRTAEHFGEITEPGCIVFTRLLPGLVERVWAYLTESEKRAKWLASGDTELKAGGKVMFHFKHSDLSDVDYPIPEKYRDMENGLSFTGRVLQVEPPSLLCYTWGEGSHEASEVTFELKPQGEKVLLTLTHRKLTKGEMVSVASGWHTHLEILADWLEGKSPAGFWKTHAELEQIYTTMVG
jgi:uncharacterized protein YndB with AHSA1/START domain